MRQTNLAMSYNKQKSADVQCMRCVTVLPCVGADEQADSLILASTVKAVLAQAAKHSMQSIAMPLIGAGAAGWPPQLAAKIHMEQVLEFVSQSSPLQACAAPFHVSSLQVGTAFSHPPSLLACTAASHPPFLQALTASSPIPSLHACNASLHPHPFCAAPAHPHPFCAAPSHPHFFCAAPSQPHPFCAAPSHPHPFCAAPSP